MNVTRREFSRHLRRVGSRCGALVFGTRSWTDERVCGRAQDRQDEDSEAHDYDLPVLLCLVRSDRQH